MAPIKALGVKGVYSTDDIDFNFEFTGHGINESAQKQGAAGGENKFINQVLLMHNLKDVIENAHLIRVYPEEEYIEAENEHSRNNELEYTYVLASSLLVGDDLIPIKLSVREYKGSRRAKLYVAMAMEPIKKSEVNVASLN